MTLDQVLLGIIASLVGALVYVVKRDSKTQAILIQSLTDAVQAFKGFQIEEEDQHQKLTHTQHDIIKSVERLHDKLHIEFQRQREQSEQHHQELLREIKNNHGE